MTTDLTPERVRGWRALAEAAMPGPLLDKRGRVRLEDRCICVACRSWTPHEHPESHDHDDDCAAKAQERAYRVAARELDAVAREAVPALCDEVERLRAERDHLDEILSDCWDRVYVALGGSPPAQGHLDLLVCVEGVCDCLDDELEEAKRLEAERDAALARAEAAEQARDEARLEADMVAEGSAEWESDAKRATWDRDRWEAATRALLDYLDRTLGDTSEARSLPEVVAVAREGQ